MGFDNSMPASQVENLDKLKILITGASGSGKTTLAAKFDRPFIALTELQGMRTITDTNPNAVIFHNAEGRAGVRDFNDIIELVKMFADPRMAEFDCFVLDSLEDLMDKIKRHYEIQIPDASHSMKRWGMILDKTNSILRMIRDLPTNVVVTCLDNEVDDGGSIIHRPAVFGKTGGFPNKLPKYFNLVGYMYKKPSDKAGEMQHEVMFGGPEKYLTKNLNGIQNIEAPEPKHWLAKVLKTEIDDVTAKRVAAWEKGRS